MGSERVRESERCVVYTRADGKREGRYTHAHTHTHTYTHSHIHTHTHTRRLIAMRALMKPDHPTCSC